MALVELVATHSPVAGQPDFSSVADLRASTYAKLGVVVSVAAHTAGKYTGGGQFRCISLSSSGYTDDNGFTIITASGAVFRRHAVYTVHADMFGYVADFNVTTQVGTDNAPAIRKAIAAAVSLGYATVVLPAGPALVDVTDADINLGGQGYSGASGVRIQGQGQQNTRLYVNGPLGSVCFSNIGGSGTNSYKSISGLTVRCNNASTRNVILYELRGCCFSHNQDLYIANGLTGIRFNNAPGAGSFTEFNTFSNCRVQGCLSNISFEVNGGDNSFHGNSFVNVQNQILSGATYGAGVRVLGSTTPAYLYNQTWDMKFFGGSNCRAFLLTNCNTDNIGGNLSFEGNIICETTDASVFEFKGNLSGISSVSYIVATPTTIRTANFVFSNALDNYNAFTNSTLSSYTPRVFPQDLADLTDNGVGTSTWRVRNSAGADGTLFNTAQAGPGWWFTTTGTGTRLQAAVPKYSLGPDGNSFTGFTTTLYINPSNSTYGLQLSSAGTCFAARTDNTLSLGTAAYRWGQVYSINSAISTSDKRHKTNLRDASSAELEAFYEVGKLPGVWQWLTVYAEEGDLARLHAGPTVQDAMDVLTSHGLDWTRYACFCYQEESEELPEGLYALRKEELLFWLLAATMHKQGQLEQRLVALEAL